MISYECDQNALEYCGTDRAQIHLRNSIPTGIHVRPYRMPRPPVLQAEIQV